MLNRIRLCWAGHFARDVFPPRYRTRFWHHDGRVLLRVEVYASILSISAEYCAISTDVSVLGRLCSRVRISLSRSSAIRLDAVLYTFKTCSAAATPGLSIGVGISLAIFGVSFCQVVVYFRYFPDDSRRLKLVILTVFLLDCLHTAGLLGTFWHILVSCHRNASSDCQMSFSWETLVTIVGNYIINLSVHSFYVHRMWIISRRNKLVTGAIVLAAFFQILFGLLCANIALQTRAGSVCDAFITISVAYFLRTEQLRIPRRENSIRQLKTLLVETGLVSCMFSVSVVITLMLPSSKARQYWP
ncbi:hypothetical protein M405DRAFT_414383 [Rhizopogon salebrosus TDB-379]|nr:hypothetical protein M405DRAFT_414383 [Rhizopogon salebrosus TDB-379]